MSSRLAEFTSERVVGGQTTLSWQNLIANLNDFFAANNVIYQDLWIEQRSSTRRGIDKLFAFLLYRELGPNGQAPTYLVDGNTGGKDTPTWFANLTDSEGATARTVALVPAPTVPGSDAENGKQYLRIYIETPAPTFGTPQPGSAYIGEAVDAIPASGQGLVTLFSSDLTVALGNVTVRNSSMLDSIVAGERVYVTIDPATGIPLAVPSCC